jgi:cell wall-associated NlpC family hydrolase
MVLRSKLNEVATKYIGSPYLLGGSTKEGIDCSGLTMMAAKEAFGILLPHYTYAQVNDAHLVGITRDQIRSGDLLFFHNNAHVAIYDAHNQGVIDAEPHSEYHNGALIPGGVYRRPMAPGYYIDWVNVNAIRRFRLPFWKRFELA